MTKFVHIDFHPEHRGIARIEGGVNHLRQIVARFDGARGAASLLVAALVSALLVAANQMVDAWGDGHLVAGWMVLWAIAFTAPALLSAPARNAVVALRTARRAWMQARQREADDEKTWNAALHDARIMADLSRAMNGIAVEDMRRYA